MKLYSIEDGYFFKTDQPKGTHTYAIFFDNKKRQYGAIPTTHLYKPDAKRMKQVESGFLLKQKLPGISLPSGVKNYAHMTDVNGHKINIKDSRVKELSKKHLSRKISERILEHASGRYMVKGKKKNSRKKREPKE